MRGDMDFGRFPGALILTAVLLAATACQERERGGLVGPVDPSTDGVTLSLAASSFTADPGGHVTLALLVDGPITVAGVEGVLRYDPSRLRYAGVVPEPGTPVIVNPGTPQRGRLKLVSVHPQGFDRRSVAVLSFQVLDRGYEAGLSFQAEYVASPGLDPVAHRFEERLGQMALPGVEGRHMSRMEWARFLDPSVSDPRPASRAATTPGIAGADLWGDVDLSPLSAGVVNVFDLLAVAELNVNLRPCAKSASEDCWVGSVEPQNDGPDGVGGEVVCDENGCEITVPNEGCPPGFDDPTCVSPMRTINVFDVLAIAQDNVGNPDHPVAGELIWMPPPIGPGDTLDIVTTFTGTPCPSPTTPVTLTGISALVSGKLWVLSCPIRIGDADAPADSGRLVVEAGTRIEGLDSAWILITQNGRIEAIGTEIRPVVFTCYDDATSPGTAPGVRAAGCWGGVHIAGNARVNEGEAGVPGSVALPGRTGAGVPRRALPGLPAPAYFGGDNDADDSGAIRYAIFAYGGFPADGGTRPSNLTLAALGSGTTLEYIETFAGAENGFEWLGGRAGAHHLVAIGNTGTAFDFSFGFDGELQFLIGQGAPATAVPLGASDAMFRSRNNEAPSDPTVSLDPPGPTMPNIWNVTLVLGEDSGTPDGTAYSPARGAGAFFANQLVLGAASVFAPQDDGTCGLVPGGAGNTADLALEWERTVVYPSGSSTVVDPACSGGPLQAFTDYHTAQRLGGTVVIGAYAGQLKDPWSFAGPDFGVNPGVGLPIVGLVPPAGLDTSADFVGAVDPTGGIPWYTGWIINGVSGVTPGS